MRILFSIFIAVVAMAVSSCVTGPRIAGINDPLEDRVSLSSESFSAPMLLRYESADPFFRGWITKATGKESHQLYLRVNSGGDFENWKEVVFLQDGKRRAIAGNRVAYDADANEYGVVYYEDIVVNVDRPLIDWISKQKEVRMRLNSGKSNKKIDFVVTGKEALSYIETINEARKALNTK